MVDVFSLAGIGDDDILGLTTGKAVIILGSKGEVDGIGAGAGYCVATGTGEAEPFFDRSICDICFSFDAAFNPRSLFGSNVTCSTTRKIR